MAGRRKQKRTAKQAQEMAESNWLDESEPVNSEHQKMLEWLKTVKFKKTLINGVDEEDVWRKLEELNDMYEASLIEERAGNEALFDAYVNSAQAELKKYKMAVKTMKGNYDELVQKNRELEQRLELLTGKRSDDTMDQEDHSAGHHER